MSVAANKKGKLIDKLKEMPAGDQQEFSIDEIAELISKLMINLSDSLVEKGLDKDLAVLSSFVLGIKQEVIDIRSEKINLEHVTPAIKNLRQIIESTESATENILNAASNIEALSKKMPSNVSDLVVKEVTNIYQSCTFQDLTGQVTTSVITTLKHVEKKLNQLLKACGEDVKQQA